jgi:uncharacterized protein YcsI (UPF0317 family)
MTTQIKNPKELRKAIRNKRWHGSTNGVCPGYVQTNLVILPKEFAFDFTIFCLRNPKACPILEILDPGDPKVKEFATDADIRTDLSKYYIYKYGNLVEETNDIIGYWQNDLVSFLIGCSYTFEEALVRGGVPVRNYEKGKDPGIYISSIMSRPSNIFSGPIVVTMRPIKPHLVSRAVQITSRMPKVHGAPIHIGDGTIIGIPDLTKIDFGQIPEIEEYEIPVFWGCGITSQMAALESKIPLMITHKPCHMFVSDKKIEELTIP